MLDEKKLLTIAVIISLIGTSSLYIYSASQEAEKLKISEIDEQEVGAIVETTGVISEVENLGDRYKVILKEEGVDSSLVLYIEELVISQMDDKEEIRTGATSWAKGRIELYQGELNMMVTGPGEFSIEKTAYSSFTPLNSLLENPRWYEGMDCKVRGEIVQLDIVVNDTLLEINPLNDENCVMGIRIYDWDFTEEYSISLGKTVVVKGTFIYDSYYGRWIVMSNIPPEVH